MPILDASTASHEQGMKALWRTCLIYSLSAFSNYTLHAGTLKLGRATARIDKHAAPSHVVATMCFTTHERPHLKTPSIFLTAWRAYGIHVEPAACRSKSAECCQQRSSRPKTCIHMRCCFGHVLPEDCHALDIQLPWGSSLKAYYLSNRPQQRWKSTAVFFRR